LHYVVLERWSRGHSLVHARDARVKLLAALVFLVAVATTPVPLSPAPVVGYAAFLLAGTLLARLPLAPVLARAAVVLPFSVVFAAASLLAGDSQRALALVVKSCLSACAVLLLVASTPLPQLLRGLEKLGMPRMLALVVQFVYRYLFVISAQGQHMRLAAESRGGFRGALLKPDAARRSRFRAAAGALAVLFGRSYQRAEAIHRAMLGRGFQDHWRLLAPSRIGWADVMFLAAAVAPPILLRAGWGAGL